MKPNKLTEEEKKEMQTKFPNIKKIKKKRKTIKECLHAIKNYDYAIAELGTAKEKIKTLEKFNDSKQQTIYRLMKQSSDNEKLFVLKLKENEKLIKKLKETEEKRRAAAGKAGGLTTKVNSLEKEKIVYKQMVNSKDKDLEQAALIIKNLNNKIKSLKNKPTMEELRYYERTRKSPKKKNSKEVSKVI
jgi:hypothetical protein